MLLPCPAAIALLTSSSVVHAKGAGAYGVFEVTDDISDLTCANLFSEVGKKTPVLVRFSTVGGEKGSADTARDPRGFAVKFFTDEGNWDLVLLPWFYPASANASAQVMNNTPVFFLRDPSKFPLFIHTQKRNPQTNLKDPDMFWDYLSTNPESVHQVMILFSDRGTPDGYTHMNGYSGHTLKFVDRDGSFYYVQIHFKIDRGIKNLNNEAALELSGSNPDYATQHLFEEIESGNHPSWTCYVQVLSPEQAEKLRWNIFDLTKVWPHSEVPLRRFGKMTLNKNPVNYFAEIEQAAFSPSHLVPGVEASADPVLQSRLFSYPDTHRHRLGVNYQQIPVNRPRCPVFNFQRDGFMAVDGNFGANPNYIASDRPVKFKKVATSEAHEQWTAHALTFMHQITDDDFAQPNALWEKVLAKQPGQQDALVHNISVHLCNARKNIRERQYGVFDRVCAEMGNRIREATEALAAKSAHPVEAKL